MLNPILPSVDSDLGTAHPKQLAFETRCVKVVLTKFGLPDKEEYMREEVYDEYMRNHARPKLRSPRPQLTIAVFRKVFPTFPVVLEAHSFYGTTHDPRFRLSTLMRSFERSLIFEQYCTATFTPGTRRRPTTDRSAWSFPIRATAVP
jgi:hypothetical protein